MNTYKGSADMRSSLGRPAHEKEGPLTREHIMRISMTSRVGIEGP